MKALNAIALVLAAVGAINWGLVAFLDLNLVAALLGGGTLAAVVYGLVALGGLWSLTLLGKVMTDDVHNGDDVRRDTTYDRDPAYPVHGKTAQDVAKPRSDATRSATASDMTVGGTHAIAVPASTEEASPARAAHPRGEVPSDSAIGTTHDPNSVTTGTVAEPAHDVFPPKAREPERRIN